MNHVTLSEAVDMIVPRDIEWFAGAVFRESGVKVAGERSSIRLIECGKISFLSRGCKCTVDQRERLVTAEDDIDSRISRQNIKSTAANDFVRPVMTKD